MEIDLEENYFSSLEIRTMAQYPSLQGKTVSSLSTKNYRE